MAFFWDWSARGGIEVKLTDLSVRLTRLADEREPHYKCDAEVVAMREAANRLALLEAVLSAARHTLDNWPDSVALLRDAVSECDEKPNSSTEEVEDAE